MIALLLSLLLIAPMGSANSLQCVDLFAKPLAEHRLPKQAQSLVNADKWQEAAWWLADNGYIALAAKLDQQILQEMVTHAPKTIQKKQWKQLSRSDQDPERAVQKDSLPATRNETYLVPVGRLNAVIKFNRHAAIHEVLAYEVAQVLGVKVPATISIVIDGAPASLQYYVADKPTGMQASQISRVEDINHSWKTSFFDYIFRNSDRHDENFLLDLPTAEVNGKSQNDLNKTEQILIDNELMFDRWQSLLDTRPSAFMRSYVPSLYFENPQFAARLANPDVQQKVLEVIAKSKIKSKKEILLWIEDTLGLYQRVYSAHFE